MPKTVDEIVAAIRAQNPIPGQEPAGIDLFGTQGSSLDRRLSGMSKPSMGTPAGPPKVQSVKFDVNPREIYQRMSDGSYMAKYDNYSGATGNENRLAQEQTSTEQWLNGIGKATAKTLGYALDSVVGTIYGIGAGIASGDFSDVWDNDFTDIMDDYNKTLDYTLPNYYTDEQRSMGVLESMGTANFWANDFAGGLAFVGGALLPELAIGALTGGASIGVGAGKLAAKLGGKSIMKGTKVAGLAAESVEQATKMSKLSRLVDPANTLKVREKGGAVIRQMNRAMLGKRSGDMLDTAAFIARTSNFEAGMEARHNLHDAVDTFYRDFQDANGRQPNYEEASEFMDKAVKAGNYVYAANMAILSVSNAVMFGKTFNIGTDLTKSLNNAGDRLIGLGTKRTAGEELARRSVSKGQKALGNAYFILGKPATEGLYEEGLQGVAGTTMQNYLSSMYDPEADEVMDVWASFTDALAHQYGSSEGWKEMVIGGLIGSLAPVMQGGAPSGFFSDSYKARSKNLDERISSVNKNRTELITQRVKLATSQAQIGKLVDSGDTKLNSVGTENSLLNVQFIKTQESFKSHNEIRQDFNAVIDNMSLTDEQIEELGGTEGVSKYKASLKQEFENDLSDYRFAKKAIEAVGLDRGVKDSEGNIKEVSDALVMNIVTGKRSLQNAKIVAEQIDTLIGKEGSFNYLEHYRGLSSEKRSKIKEIKSKKGQVEVLRNQADKYQRRLVELNNSRRGKAKNEKLLAKYNEASAIFVNTNEKITDLEKEIEDISKALDSDIRAENFDINQLTTVDPTTTNIEETIAHLDEIDRFVESLKASGKDSDAAILNDLLERYRMYSDAHREMNNNYRRMLDTNFFSTKEGKGLFSMITGKRYKMSDEFKAIIKENEALIDRSLRTVTFTDGRTSEQIIEEWLENNNEFSDREKYRIESLIRLQLGHARIAQRLEDIQDKAEITESEAEQAPSPLEGDTVRLKTRLRSNAEGRSNLDVINGMIRQIFEEIDAFRKFRSSKTLLDKIDADIKALDDIKVEEEAEAGDYAKVKALANRISEGSEVSREEDLQLQENYKKLLEVELNRIELNEQKRQAKEGSFVKMIESSDYQRMSSLLSKKRVAKLTPQEEEELAEIEDKINMWINLTGTVVEGMRLSDLISQKIVLEQTPIAKVEDVKEVSSQDTLDAIETAESSQSVSYAYGQTYQAVTARRNKQGYVEVSGITPEQLVNYIGFDIPFVENEQGNTVIMDTDGSIIKQINENSPVSILSTNKDLRTSYSVVLITEENVAGETVTRPLETNFMSDFDKSEEGGENRNRLVMDPDALYSKVKGEELILEISPRDGYNRDFIARYNKAKNNKEEFEALKEEMRNSLVIRVKDRDGNFLAVLKGKRRNAERSETSSKFEALRDMLVEDTQLMASLTSVGMDEELNITGLKVDTIMPGHPNYRFKKNEDGTMSIESTQISEEDIPAIKDVGYVQNGELRLRSGATDEVRKSFIAKSIAQGGKEKVPVIVLEKGGSLIAYPVKAIPSEKPSLDEFFKIYKGSASPTDKANALNQFMAERGVDIKEPGNSFVSYGDTNLNDDFFNDKVAQLNSINYFHNFEDWLNPSVSIASLVGKGMSVDINLKNPFHSPKLKMSFEDVPVQITEVEKAPEVKKQVKKRAAGKGIEALTGKIIKEDC